MSERALLQFYNSLKQCLITILQRAGPIVSLVIERIVKMVGQRGCVSWKCIKDADFANKLCPAELDLHRVYFY